MGEESAEEGGKGGGGRGGSAGETGEREGGMRERARETVMTLSFECHHGAKDPH